MKKKHISSGRTDLTAAERHAVSGQATVELAALLIGFVAVFLGLVFICSLADSDINVFLQARHNAELRAENSDAVTGSGAEFAEATNYRHDIYNDRPTLIFAPLDQPNYSSFNTIKSFHSAFSGDTSNQPAVMDDYSLQATLDKWKDLRNADSHVFRSDFVEDLSEKNALEAARLVSGRSYGVDQLSLIERNQKPGTSSALRQALYRWFGVRLSEDALENAPGNRVYMPVMR